MIKKVYFTCILLFFLTVFTILTTILNYYVLLANEKTSESVFISITEEYNKIIHIIETNQFIDKSGSFAIVPSIIVPKYNINTYKHTVTLITHCSPNYLYHILDISKLWNGPISLSLFSDGSYPSIALDILLNLIKCFPKAFSLTKINFIFQSNANFKMNLPNFDETVICDNLQNDLKLRANVFKSYEYMHVEYPNNLLRNVAIKSSKTSHILVIDIDILPSFNLFEKLTIFLKSKQSKKNLVNKFKQKGYINPLKENNKKIAYVLPSFEVSESVLKLPINKKELLELWDQHLLKPFYFDMCLKCQQPTNYNYWRNYNMKEDGSIRVNYKAQWKDRWEPFSVIPISAPRFDERFRQYGFNRISQSCELHMLGYDFHVLDLAFLLHIGFKSNTSFHINKDIEQNINRMHYNIFKKEMKNKYANTNRSCD